MRLKCAKVKERVDAGYDKPSRRSIFYELLASEMTATLSVDDMTDIALTIVVAAAAGTGNALSMIAYHVISNPDIYAQLRVEIIAAYPNDKQIMDWVTLEKLPYLVSSSRL